MKFTRAASVAAVVVLSMSAATAAPTDARLLTWPGYAASWDKGIGLPDQRGNANAGLALEKIDPFADRGFGGAAFTGVEGLPLTELGFSRRIDGVCGDFLLYHLVAADGQVYTFACATGIATPVLGPGGVATDWARVRFAIPPNVVIHILQLRLKMPVGLSGAAVVDDIDVNGTLLGKP